MTVTGTLWSLQLNLLSVSVLAAPPAHSEDELRILELLDRMKTITVRDVIINTGMDDKTARRRLEELTPAHTIMINGRPLRWRRNGG